MKLKTLLLIVAILCVSLFVVACNGEETTTAANDDPQSGDVTTTAKAATTTTTKATTKKTTVTTTTVAVTTIPADLIAKLPAKLPDNSSFEIQTRIGLEAESDFLGLEIYGQNLQFTTTGAIYGNCISVEVKPDAQYPRIQHLIDLADPFLIEGVKGVMWYVDFSNANPIAGTPMCASTTINVNTYRTKVVNGVANSGIGYYFKDGQWVQTQAVNACRFEIPNNFKGWMYAPITSYNGAGDLFDAATGLGLGNVIVQNIRLYTDGYEMVAGRPITFDEVLYVK